ncbi:L domain-like protein [Lojkania enalia]|uniref:U2 small nuclear ribonucleoprotein A' n=1 Tax=Lojkania enalia TaxID=147567 RepID=A0A9P4KJM8_9PLEO|nr:L domain-like protein [Didymosphaeria enalia]
MGAARNNDAIDFTDNDISQLGGFPLFPRLHSLLLAQNRIVNIQANVSANIPGLAILVLTKNRISELADLDPLQGCKNLVHLSLLENPVTSKEHYRHWIIYRLPTVRFLDYQRVTRAERLKATSLFGTADEPTELATKIMGIKSKNFILPTHTNGESESVKERIWTDEEKRKIRAAIANAGKLEDLAKLEKAFAEGKIPAWVLEATEAMGS